VSSATPAYLEIAEVDDRPADRIRATRGCDRRLASADPRSLQDSAPDVGPFVGPLPAEAGVCDQSVGDCLAHRRAWSLPRIRDHGLAAGRDIPAGLLGERSARRTWIRDSRRSGQSREHRNCGEGDDQSSHGPLHSFVGHGATLRLTRSFPKGQPKAVKASREGCGDRRALAESPDGRLPSIRRATGGSVELLGGGRPPRVARAQEGAASAREEHSRLDVPGIGSRAAVGDGRLPFVMPGCSQMVAGRARAGLAESGRPGRGSYCLAPRVTRTEVGDRICPL